MKPLLLLGLCLFAVDSNAVELAVPSSGLTTIQAAIDAAEDYDEIVVSPGTYAETLVLNGKTIILRSTEPDDPAIVETTVIDAAGAGSAITFAGTETADCLLTGFTIVNGYAGNGAGINGNGTEASIVGNRIRSNYLSNGGQGAGIYNCQGLIEGNVISENDTFGYGGGLAACHGTIYGNTIRNNGAYVGGGFYNCNGLISENDISENSGDYGGGLSYCNGTIEGNRIKANGASGGGGGLFVCMAHVSGNEIVGNYTFDRAYGGGAMTYCNGVIEGNYISENYASYIGGALSYCNGTVQNNMFAGNSSGDLLSPNGVGYGGALSSCGAAILNNTFYDNMAALQGGALEDCLGQITNNILWNNIPDQLVGCSVPDHCCIEGWADGGVGNVSEPPQFADADAGDFHLTLDSPCIDAGAAIPQLTTDFEGDPRPSAGLPALRIAAAPMFDIGADEFVPGNGDGDPPTADAGGPYNAAANSWDGAEVTLDGTGSSAADGGGLTYAWDLDLSNGSGDVDATGPNPTATFPLGQTEIMLTVTDSAGNTASDTTMVTVGCIEVVLDVKPRNPYNVVSLQGNGLVPVAFLGSETFDVQTIDPRTVTVRGGNFNDGLVREVGHPSQWPLAFFQDVNDDGQWDLFCLLEKEKLAAFDLGPVWELGALTYNGEIICGSDTVQVIRSGLGNGKYNTAAQPTQGVIK